MRPRWLIVAGLLLVLAFSARYLTAQTLPFPSGGVASSISSGSSGPPSLFPNGTETAPSIAFASVPGIGLWRQASNVVALQVGPTGSFNIRQVGSTALNMSIGADTTSANLNLSSGGIRFNSDGSMLGNVRGITATASTVPTCTGNCGGGAVVNGNNTFMRVNLGASSPGNPFAVVFSTSYNNAPMCQAQLAQTTSPATASVASVNATATGVSVNLVTAPANSGIYTISCVGFGTP